jgi:F-box-like
MPLHLNPLRLRAKSSVGRDVVCFNILPNELILDILELAVLDGKKTALTLAVVCKRISQLMDFILYRTIVLSSPESIALLLRTVKARHNSFFASHVRKLVVTYMYDSRTFMTMRRG